MSIIPTHPSKRRRLHQGRGAVLSRPFKVPLKASPSTPGFDSRRTNTETATADCAAAAPPPPPPKPITTPTLNPHSTATRKTLTPSRSQSRLIQNHPGLLTLQKEHTSLLNRLTAIRASLDTAQQALEIVSHPKTDSELEGLIGKWRQASREAAEELFPDARERVKDMGGMKAWRESEGAAGRGRRRLGAWDGWDRKPGDDLVRLSGGYEEEERAMRRVKLQEEEEEEEEERRLVEHEDADDSFTMDIMLSGLNVDLDTIGFDKENQRWAD